MGIIKNKTNQNKCPCFSVYLKFCVFFSTSTHGNYAIEKRAKNYILLFYRLATTIKALRLGMHVTRWACVVDILFVFLLAGRTRPIPVIRSHQILGGERQAGKNVGVN